MCCGIVGLFNGGEDEETDSTAKATAVDFIDNPEKYKGQVLEFTMRNTSSVGKFGVPLRERSGTWARFSLGESGASADVAVEIPADLDMPNVGYFDKVVVRFRCNDGDLLHGNEAIEIRRP